MADLSLVPQLVSRELRVAAAERATPKCRLCRPLIRGAAAIGAFACLAWHVLRYGARARPLPHTVWLACHDEWSNRTRHLLALAEDMPQPVPLLLLGRPRRSDAEFRAMVGDKLPGATFELVRPFGPGALLRSLPAIFAATWRAGREMAKSDITLPAKELTAIFYRAQLGCVCARWWNGRGYRPDVVIFGHTGNADVSLLERALQENRTVTVHLFHGYSNGEPFTGISDVAITKCSSDAEWHQKRGGYGRTVAVPAAVPPLSSPSRRWALLTNYAHPTAFASAVQGTDFEIALLELVAAAADRMGVVPAEIGYRPHPALKSLPDDLQNRVGQGAKRLKLGGWEAGEGPSGLAQFEIVLTTPSTIAGDALLAGTIPVVIALTELQEGSAYKSYPFTARTCDEAVRIIGDIESDRQAAFIRAWNAIGPAVTPSAAEIAELARPLDLASRVLKTGQQLA